MPFPPKSAMHVPPAFRARRIPNPSPAGGAPLGAPARGLQYGNQPRTGKAWIPRPRNGHWVRDSPKDWRQPRKRLTAAMAAAAPAPSAPPANAHAFQKPKPSKREYKFDLGWGVSAPAPRPRAAGGARGRPTAWVPPRQQPAAAAPPAAANLPQRQQQQQYAYQPYQHGYQTRAALRQQAAARMGQRGMPMGAMPGAMPIRV